MLQAITIAEIATYDGTKIPEDALEGRCGKGLREHFQWPRNPPKLHGKFWDLWKQALRKATIRPYSSDRTLTTQLGPWKAKTLSNWKWGFSEDGNRVYHREGAL